MHNTPKDKNNFRRSMKFTRSAREGWKIILESLRPGARVLLPSYIGITDREGSGIFDPISELNIDYDFYLLENDLSISFSQLENKIQTEKYDLILFVHYFGFEIPDLEENMGMFRKHNIIVVEDCAHLYNINCSNYSKAGTYGDFVFYSLHKNFPFKEGGILISNSREEDGVFEDANSTSEFSIAMLHYDNQEIVRKRRANFAYLYQMLENKEGITVFKNISDRDIPHNLPILVENGLREKLYFWLLENNCAPIALYYRLIDPLKEAAYSTMQHISDNILNLPIHQDIAFEDLELINSKINEFYNRYKTAEVIL